jgi:hypothetical protein
VYNLIYGAVAAGSRDAAAALPQGVPRQFLAVARALGVD